MAILSLINCNTSYRQENIYSDQVFVSFQVLRKHHLLNLFLTGEGQVRHSFDVIIRHGSRINGN